MRLSFVLFLFLLSITTSIYAGGIRGYIRAADGTALEYATVLVRQTGDGAITNQEGYYEIRVPAGTYSVVYQFMGYATEVREVAVGSGFTDADLRLQPQVLDLKEIEIYEGREDPAYTVMRKAIAKADYHRKQIDYYRAQVYIKGSGRLLKSPWYARRELKKEGIDSTVAFTSESVSIVEYERPATFRERVVSVYKQGEDSDTSPMGYINGSFYHPEIAGAVSPLSPRAFGYYKFRLDGYYQDQGYSVNKIAVIPRSRGDNVFEGYIYIVEDLWSIHSLQLKTWKLGIGFGVQQVYSPIKANAWLPVTAKIDIEGKVLGFAFEYRYLASLSDYNVRLNPDLPDEFTVIDERVNRELAEEVRKRNSQRAAENATTEDKLSTGQEVTRRELRKIIRQYEREEEAADEKPDTMPTVVSTYEYKVDSLAAQRDSSYWTDIRPIPLTQLEQRGYVRIDSINRAERLEAASKISGDTLSGGRRANGRFGASDLLFGDSQKWGKHYFDYPGVLLRLRYTAVEGLSVGLPFRYRIPGKKNSFELGATPRYALAWDRGLWHTHATWQRKQALNAQSITLEGGRDLFQYNADNPIPFLLNTFSTLLSGKNYVRLYEQAYAQARYRTQWASTASLQLTANGAERRTVRNHTDYYLFRRGESRFAPNVPNTEGLITPLPERERALVLSAQFDWRPWQTYRLHNGERRPVRNNSPLFSFAYRKGIPNVSGSVTDYDLIDFTYRHTLAVRAAGKLDLRLNAGKFVNNNYIGFADYKHFPGVEIRMTDRDPVSSFRLLPYYQYSTPDEYVAAHAHYQFRKLLLSRIWEVQMLGIRENFFVNYLATPTSNNYVEVGYSIDNILRVLRLELAWSFQDGRYRDFGIMIGVASNLGGNLIGVNFD